MPGDPNLCESAQRKRGNAALERESAMTERIFLTTRYTDAVQHLVAKRWTKEQAEGIARCLLLDSKPLNICGWEGQRWSRLSYRRILVTT